MIYFLKITFKTNCHTTVESLRAPERKNWFSRIRNPPLWSTHTLQHPPPIYPDNPHPFGTCCPPNHPQVYREEEEKNHRSSTTSRRVKRPNGQLEAHYTWFLRQKQKQPEEGGQEKFFLRTSFWPVISCVPQVSFPSGAGQRLYRSVLDWIHLRRTRLIGGKSARIPADSAWNPEHGRSGTECVCVWYQLPVLSLALGIDLIGKFPTCLGTN